MRNLSRSVIVAGVSALAVGLMFVSVFGTAHAGPNAVDCPAPVLVGQGAALFKVVIQKVGSSTATVGWLGPACWSHFEDVAGEPQKAEGVTRKPTAIAATIQGDLIPGFTTGDKVVIYKLSDTPWFSNGPDCAFSGQMLSADILATGWSY